MSAVKGASGGKTASGRLTEALMEAGLGDFFDPGLASARSEQLSSHYCPAEELEGLKEIVQWLDDERAANHIFAKRKGLNDLLEWGLDEDGYLSQVWRRFFKVVGVRVTSPHREVRTWSQPILDNEGTGIIGLLVRKIGDRSYFLMQAKPDVGNRNIVQLGPTVQFNPGNYIDNDRLTRPFLFEEFMNPAGYAVLKESRQAEEGGRFYREEHIHRILLLPEDSRLDIPPQYRWLTYGQIRFFLHLGDVVNSSARSILACLA